MSAEARFGAGAAAESADHFDWADSPEALGTPPLDYLGQAKRQVREGARGLRGRN